MKVLHPVPPRGQMIKPYPPASVLEEVQEFAAKHKITFDQALAVIRLAEERTTQLHWVYDLDCQDERAVALDKRLDELYDLFGDIAEAISERQEEETP